MLALELEVQGEDNHLLFHTDIALSDETLG